MLERMGHIVEEIAAPFSASEVEEVLAGFYYLGFVGLDDTASASDGRLTLSNLIILQPMLPLSHVAKVLEAHGDPLRCWQGSAKLRSPANPTMPCTALHMISTL